MNPIISIIVPVYNVEDYLKQCIESILNQEFQDFELILVNDGSSDSSGEICDNYAKNETRIKVLHKDNGGQSTARNLGLDQAIGDYIGFVDSDDWVHEEMYSKLIHHAIKYNSDIVACNFFVMKKDLGFYSYTKAASNQEFTRESAMKEIFRNEILTYSPCNKIYKKSLFNSNRFVEGIILEDKDISYKLINKSDIISYIKDELYYYRYNDASTLRSEFVLKRLDEYIVQKNMYNFYKNQYSEVADLVYYELFSISVFLYAQIAIKFKMDKSKYQYLVEFDQNILKRLLNNKQLKKKDKAKLLIGMYLPNTYINLKKLCNFRTKMIRWIVDTFLNRLFGLC